MMVQLQRVQGLQQATYCSFANLYQVGCMNAHTARATASDMAAGSLVLGAKPDCCHSCELRKAPRLAASATSARL